MERTHISAARRSLFGPVDRELLRLELSQRLRDITEQDSRRWNFDFQSHAPLPGRFRWEAVSAQCTAAFYSVESGAARKGQTSAKREEEAEERLRGPGDGEEGEEAPISDQENCPRDSNARKCPPEVTPTRRKRARPKAQAEAARSARNTRVTRITDFFAKRRRSTETKSPVPLGFPLSTDAPLRTLR